jgi:hypothetical protein
MNNQYGMHMPFKTLIQKYFKEYNHIILTIGYLVTIVIISTLSVLANLNKAGFEPSIGAVLIIFVITLAYFVSITFLKLPKLGTVQLLLTSFTFLSTIFHLLFSFNSLIMYLSITRIMQYSGIILVAYTTIIISFKIIADRKNIRGFFYFFLCCSILIVCVFIYLLFYGLTSELSRSLILGLFYAASVSVIFLLPNIKTEYWPLKWKRQFLKLIVTPWILSLVILFHFKYFELPLHQNLRKDLNPWKTFDYSLEIQNDE